MFPRPRRPSFTPCTIARIVAFLGPSTVFPSSESEREANESSAIQANRSSNLSVPMTHCKCQFCAVHGPWSWPRSNLSCRAGQACGSLQLSSHMPLQRRKCCCHEQLPLRRRTEFHGLNKIEKIVFLMDEEDFG